MNDLMGNKDRIKAVTCLLAIAGLWLAADPVLAASFQQISNTLVMSNGNVRLEYDLATGTTDFFWKHARKLTGFYSGVTLSTGYVRGIDYSSRSFQINGTTQAVITATGAGLPAMKQFFTLIESNNFLTRLVIE